MGNVIVDKSFEFAVSVVKLADELKDKKKHELAGQILRSGTSIGANVSEAQYSQSKKDFISKMHIALKEANETDYWLKLLRAVDAISEEDYSKLRKEADEIIRILVTIIKTSKST